MSFSYLESHDSPSNHILTVLAWQTLKVLKAGQKRLSVATGFPIQHGREMSCLKNDGAPTRVAEAWRAGFWRVI